MVKRLKSEAYYVVGIDLKKPVYSDSYADEFHISDLTNRNDFENILSSYERFDEIYQYADMEVLHLFSQVKMMQI